MWSYFKNAREHIAEIDRKKKQGRRVVVKRAVEEWQKRVVDDFANFVATGKPN